MMQFHKKFREAAKEGGDARTQLVPPKTLPKSPQPLKAPPPPPFQLGATLPC
jgi:hypothetical protein